MRAFTVVPVLNGFIVEVGCQKLVFQSKEAMILAFSSYVLDWRTMEKGTLETACNRDLFPQDAPAPPTGLPPGIGDMGVGNAARAYEQTRAYETTR